MLHHLHHPLHKPWWWQVISAKFCYLKIPPHLQTIIQIYENVCLVNIDLMIFPIPSPRKKPTPMHVKENKNNYNEDFNVKNVFILVILPISISNKDGTYWTKISRNVCSFSVGCSWNVKFIWRTYERNSAIMKL